MHGLGFAVQRWKSLSAFSTLRFYRRAGPDSRSFGLAQGGKLAQRFSTHGLGLQFNGGKAFGVFHPTLLSACRPGQPQLRSCAGWKTRAAIFHAWSRLAV